MHIRPLVSDDYAEWLRLRQALWPDCDVEMHRLEMEVIGEARGTHAIYVIDTGSERLGGFIELSVRENVDGAGSERVGYVEGWYVEAGLRRQGWGRRLMEAAEAWTRDRGLTELGSDVELWNEASLRAHEALGFHETFRLILLLKPVDTATNPTPQRENLKGR